MTHWIELHKETKGGYCTGCDSVVHEEAPLFHLDLHSQDGKQCESYKFCADCYCDLCDQYPEDTTVSDEEWRHEQAMEAGMLHGIDAYNDVMGY